jgi:biotin carboxyl carrier protein
VPKKVPIKRWKLFLLKSFPIGDTVIKGQTVAVLSAMKMEMAVQSPLDGVVRGVTVKKGQKVEGDDLLVEIKEL